LVLGLIANKPPLTRWDAIVISLNIAVIFFNVALKLISRVQGNILTIVQVQEKHLNLIERIAKGAALKEEK
jgi:hypothetical protein